MTKLTIHPGKMTLEDLRIVFQQAVTVVLDKRAHAAIEKALQRSIKLLKKIEPLTVSIQVLVCLPIPALQLKICNHYNALL